MVYYTFINEEFDVLLKDLSGVSSDRIKKIDSYMLRDDKLRSVVAFFLIKKYFDDNNISTPLFFEVDKYNKPYIKNCGINFNITHSDNMVAVIFDTCNVGIDVEKIDDFSENLLEFMFDEDDLIKYNCDTENNEFNTMVWTLKEAYLKQIGCGINNSLKSLKFDYKQNNICYNNINVRSYVFGDYYLSVASKTCDYDFINVSLDDILRIK